MTQQAAHNELMRHHRPLHAERTAEFQAAFFLPHLRPGMALLDLGCGPGSITTGLAAAVAPGPTTGVDNDPVEIDGVEVTSADVMSLPFPDASFDAIFASALLQHLSDPLGALREARRVAQQVVSSAEADSRRLRHEAEDYIDQKLASFEVVLDRTMQAVVKGRAQLQAVVEPLPQAPPDGGVGDLERIYDDDDSPIFDQDDL